MKLRLTAVSALVLIGGTVAGCGGGGSGAPAEATEDEFCDGVTSVFDDMQELGPEASDSEAIQALKDWASQMEDVGTPEDIPDQAREGFELTTEAFGGLDEDAGQEQVEKMDEDLTDAEQEATQAFDDYVSETCGAGLGEMGEGETPTE